MLRGILAILAWPLGVIPAFLFMVLASPSCPGGQMCALQPMPRWQEVVFVLLLLAPGALATRWWWRGRRPAA